eukprot:m.125204 g.125204  ORF g.125204 m.125204 type:complete len:59 (-) comp13528_c0_seq2:110-286(-)
MAETARLDLRKLPFSFLDLSLKSLNLKSLCLGHRALQPQLSGTGSAQISFNRHKHALC